MKGAERESGYLMASEFEGAKLWLEVPNHHVSVSRPRDDLLHVRVEHHRCNGIMVSAEGTYQ